MITPSSKKIKILIVDDHPAFREGLRRILEDENDIEVVATAKDGEEGVALTKELLPDVVTMDLVMPGINGIEATKQIKDVCPSVAVMVLTAYYYGEYLFASLRAGAAGYFTKRVGVSELIDAIRELSTGKVVFGQSASQAILRHFEAGKEGEKQSVTKSNYTELEALIYAIAGYPRDKEHLSML